MERRYFTPPVNFEFGDDDFSTEIRSLVYAANVAAVLRNELRASAGQSGASHNPVCRLSGRIRSRRRDVSERQLSDPIEHADRDLAARNRHAHAAAMANGC